MTECCNAKSTPDPPEHPASPAAPQEIVSPNRLRNSPAPKKEIWKDYIAPVFCCFAKKEGYQEIGPETAEEMTTRIQELYTLFDRLNDQLQSVQSSSEMQRILQERLVEQVHELDDLISNNKSQFLTELQKMDIRVSTCESRAGIGEEEKALLMEEVKQNSAFLEERDAATLQRITSLEQTNSLLLAKFDNGEDGQKQVDAAFITRLADNDREQAVIKTKVSTVERKLDTLATRGYVDNLVRSLEEDRNQFITKSVERTAAFHMEQSKKELSQKQALRIGEIEGKLEGLRVLVTGLVKSVETRDAELTQMNKSYFDELQRHVDDTSEELRRTFAEFKVIKRNFEEQHRRMSTMERTIDKTGDMATIEDDIHILAKKLDRLENRVEHVVDKVVELGDRSPSPELDDLARLKRDLRKGNKPLNPSAARRRNNSSIGKEEDLDLGRQSADEAEQAPAAGRRTRQLSGLGDKSTLRRA